MSNFSHHSRQLSEGECMRLFVKNEPALRAFARSLLPDWNCVDDAIQEASVAMWEKLGQLRDEDGCLKNMIKPISGKCGCRMHMIKFGFVCTWLTIGAMPCFGAEKPNLVVIMCDDLGYADVGFNGCRDIPTPNIDRIAKVGVVCTCFASVGRWSLRMC